MTRWIHFTDLQLGLGKAENDPNDELAVEMVQTVLAQRPDFAIHAGDCIHGTAIDHEADENPEYLGMHVENWEMYRRTMAPLQTQCPVFSVVGNHDHTFPDLDTALFCHYHDRDGKPAYYSGTIDDVQVICLDVVPRPHHGGFPAGTEQEVWLREELAKPKDARCRVVVGHYPIFMAPAMAHSVDASLRYDEENNAPGLLLPMLLAADVDLYLCGHLHIYERARYEKLTQIIGGANRIGHWGVLDMTPSRFLQVQDERQSYVEFKIVDDQIEATVVSLAGEQIDAWSQPLNRPSRG